MAQNNSGDLAVQVNSADTEVLSEHDMTPAMRTVVAEIDAIFGELQSSSLSSFWQIGRLITEVKEDPERYLTEEQQSSHVDAASLLISIFAPVYTADQLRSAVTFYDRYPSPAELQRLLSLRNPERPRWRLTLSHVHMLTQVADDEQRHALEEKCAEDAYTARALALELQEIRGKKKNSGRTHKAPKGLKQQLLDLLQHQRRFIARSQTLWYNEDDNDLYDDIANAAADVQADATIRSYFAEIVENFDQLADVIRDNIGMCRKISGEVFDAVDDEGPAADDSDYVDVFDAHAGSSDKESRINR